MHPLLGYARPHYGTDIVDPRGPAFTTEGHATTIKPGKVISANSATGNVTVAHDDGTKSIYRHLDRIDVKSGDTIAQGATLGSLGDKGLSAGAHLHFEMVDNLGNKIDPMSSVGFGRMDVPGDRDAFIQNEVPTPQPKGEPANVGYGGALSTIAGPPSIFTDPLDPIQAPTTNPEAAPPGIGPQPTTQPAADPFASDLIAAFDPGSYGGAYDQMATMAPQTATASPMSTMAGSTDTDMAEAFGAFPSVSPVSGQGVSPVSPGMASAVAPSAISPVDQTAGLSPVDQTASLSPVSPASIAGMDAGAGFDEAGFADAFGAPNVGDPFGGAFGSPMSSMGTDPFAGGETMPADMFSGGTGSGTLGTANADTLGITPSSMWSGPAGVEALRAGMHEVAEPRGTGYGPVIAEPSQGMLDFAGMPSSPAASPTSGPGTYAGSPLDAGGPAPAPAAPSVPTPTPNPGAPAPAAEPATYASELAAVSSGAPSAMPATDPGMMGMLGMPMQDAIVSPIDQTTAATPAPGPPTISPSTAATAATPAPGPATVTPASAAATASPVEQAPSIAPNAPDPMTGTIMQGLSPTSPAPATPSPTIAGPLDPVAQTATVQANPEEVAPAAPAAAPAPVSVGGIPDPAQQAAAVAAAPPPAPAPQVTPSITAPNISAPYSGPEFGGSMAGAFSPQPTVPGLAPSIYDAVQQSGMQAPPGGMFGYSPFGGFATVYGGAPEHVQIAATGPGLFGALGQGFGDPFGGWSAGSDSGGLSDAGMSAVSDASAGGMGGLW